MSERAVANVVILNERSPAQLCWPGVKGSGEVCLVIARRAIALLNGTASAVPNQV